jgi:predicted dinucleotide-binding enzyme
MKIGSIGKGNVGGALTRLWQQAGHDVRAGGRDDSVADVAAYGDVVLLAVGWRGRSRGCPSSRGPARRQGLDRRHERHRREVRLASRTRG